MTATTPACTPGSTCTNSAPSARINRARSAPVLSAPHAMPASRELNFLLHQKERPGDFHPAKSSQDPHSVAAFGPQPGLDSGRILGEMPAFLVRCGRKKLLATGHSHSQYRTDSVLYRIEQDPCRVQTTS